MFTADTFSEVSATTLYGLQGPSDIVACHDDHQLYVIDWHCSIWQVSAENPSDYEKWMTDDTSLVCFTDQPLDSTLSLTSRRLLVASRLRSSLRQYSTTSRQLLRTIELPDSVKELTHAVETTRGTFVVCHVRPSAVSELFVCSLVLQLLYYTCCSTAYISQNRQ